MRLNTFVIFNYQEPKIVSDRNLAVLVRQLALHCNLASQIQKSISSAGGEPFASNCLERLRQIKRIRDKVINEQKEREAKSNDTKPPENDFTNLVIRRRED